MVLSDEGLDIETEGFYYVDKTSLISEFLAQWAKVTLFTPEYGNPENLYHTDYGIFQGKYP